MENMEFLIKNMFFAFILSNPLTGYAVEIIASPAAETPSGVIPNNITSTQFGWSGGGSQPAPVNSKNGSMTVSDSLDRPAIANKASSAAETSSGVIPNYITSTKFGWSGGGSQLAPINSNNNAISVSDSPRNAGASSVSNTAKDITVSLTSPSEGPVAKIQHNNRVEAVIAITGEPSAKRIGDALVTGANIGKKVLSSIGGILGSLFGSTSKAATSGEKNVENKNLNIGKPLSNPLDVHSFKGIGDKIISGGHAVATEHGNTDKSVAPGGVSSNGIINSAIAPGNSAIATQDNSGKTEHSLGGGIPSFEGIGNIAAPRENVVQAQHGNAGLDLGGILSLAGGIGDSAALGAKVVGTQNDNSGKSGHSLGGLLTLAGGIGDSDALGTKVVGAQNDNSGKSGHSLGGLSSFPSISGATAPERIVPGINHGNSGEAGGTIGGIPSFEGIGNRAAPRGNVVQAKHGNAGLDIGGILSLAGGIGDSAALGAKVVGTQNDNSGKAGHTLGGVLTLAGGISDSDALGTKVVGAQNDNSGNVGHTLGVVSSFPSISGAISPERSVPAINHGNFGEAGDSIGGIPSFEGISDIAALRGNGVQKQPNNVGLDLSGVLSLAGGIGDSATLGEKVIGTQNDNSGKAGHPLGGIASFPGAVVPEKSVSAINSGNSGEEGGAFGGTPSLEGIGDISTTRGNLGKPQHDNSGLDIGGLLSLIGGIGDSAKLGAKIVGTQSDNTGKAGLSLGGMASFPGMSGATAPERSVSEVKSSESGVSIGDLPLFKGIGNVASARENIGKMQHGNTGSDIDGLLSLVGGIGADVLRMHGSTIGAGIGLGGVSSSGGIDGAVASGGNAASTQHAVSSKPEISLAKASSIGSLSGAASPAKNTVVAQHGNTFASATSEGKPIGIQHHKLGGTGLSQERVHSIGETASARNVGESQYNSADSALRGKLLAGGAILPTLNHGLTPYSNTETSGTHGSNQPVVSNSHGSSVAFPIHG